MRRCLAGRVRFSYKIRIYKILFIKPFFFIGGIEEPLRVESVKSLEVSSLSSEIGRNDTGFDRYYAQLIH
jgi:hypothetical protein